MQDRREPQLPENWGKTASALRDRLSNQRQTSYTNSAGWPVDGEPRDRDSQQYHCTQDSESISSSRESTNHDRGSFRPENRTNRTPNNNDHLLEVAKFIASRDKSNSQLQIEDVDLRPLWQVQRKPPVTVESLSVLDLHRLSSYAKLYHDFHFELEIILRAEPKPDAERYWAVIAIELALYVQHNDSTTYSWLDCLTKDPEKALPLRLPSLLEAIRDILVTLVSTEDVETTNAIFDPTLLAQQILKGCCDLGSLAEYIRSVLTRSHFCELALYLDEFVEQMRKASLEQDPCLLKSAIERLFTILEGIKVEKFQSHIQRNRQQLVENSVLCEQQYFLRHIHANCELSTANSRYRERVGSQYDPLQGISAMLLDYVSGVSNSLPKTFAFDSERLELLRRAFNFSCAEVAVSVAIELLLRRSSGREWRLDAKSKDKMLGALTRHVKKVDPALSFWNASQTSSEAKTSFQAITLEIARVCNIMRRKPDAPVQGDIAAAEKIILQLMGRPTSFFISQNGNFVQSLQSVDTLQHQIGEDREKLGAELGTEVHTQLQALVMHEVDRMRGMTEVEIYSKYVLGESLQPPGNTTVPVRLQTGADSSTTRRRPEVSFGMQVSPSLDSLDRFQLLAQRIAHIAVIHWRVWGPILCNQKVES